MYQRARVSERASQVGRVACLLATVDLTKPRVHLYERILQGRSRGAACYPLIEVNHGAKCGGGDGGSGSDGDGGGGRDDEGRRRVDRNEGRERERRFAKLASQ